MQPVWVRGLAALTEALLARLVVEAAVAVAIPVVLAVLVVRAAPALSGRRPATAPPQVPGAAGAAAKMIITTQQARLVTTAPLVVLGVSTEAAVAAVAQARVRVL